MYFKVQDDFHIKVGSRGKEIVTPVSGTENSFGKKALNSWKIVGVLQENIGYQKKNKPQ